MASSNEVDGRAGAAAGKETSPDWSDSLRELLTPGVAGLSARLTALGAKGELHLDINTMKRQLGKLDSPVASELVNRINHMQADGWQFFQTAPGAHPGNYNESMRRIFYEPQGSMLSYSLGLGVNPIKQTLPIIAHEVAHDNGGLFYSTPDFSPADEQAMSLRKVEAETTSMLTETHIADQLGVKDIRPFKVSTEARRAAIQSGELGQYIFDTHGYIFKTPTDSQWVNAKVNNMIDTVYGGKMIDQTTGKVRAFDLNAAYGRIATPMPFDEAGRQAWKGVDYVSNRLNHPQSDVRSELGKTLHFGESEFASDAAHIAKGLGAFGLMVAAGDIVGGFEQSAGTGLRRAAKVGVDWGGYSAAAAATNAVLRVGDIAMRFPKVGTVAVVLSGFAGAYLADRSTATLLDDGKNM